MFVAGGESGIGIVVTPAQLFSEIALTGNPEIYIFDFRCRLDKDVEAFADMKRTRLTGMEPSAAENRQFKLWLGIVGVVYLGIYLIFR